MRGVLNFILFAIPTAAMAATATVTTTITVTTTATTSGTSTSTLSTARGASLPATGTATLLTNLTEEAPTATMPAFNGSETLQDQRTETRVLVPNERGTVTWTTMTEIVSKPKGKKSEPLWKGKWYILLLGGLALFTILFMLCLMRRRKYKTPAPTFRDWNMKLYDDFEELNMVENKA
eukprot:Sspe_Gene.79233::Locus_49655_Transcript_1_1_Confidence_1.000_Length_1048::g.79233::m.79233